MRMRVRLLESSGTSSLVAPAEDAFLFLAIKSCRWLIMVSFKSYFGFS